MLFRYCIWWNERLCWKMWKETILSLEMQTLHSFRSLYVKQWFLCKMYIFFQICIHIYIYIYRYIYYIYIYVCVYGGNSFCFWGGGKAVESTHHGSRWYRRSWGRAQQELELLPEDGDYPPPDLSSLRQFLDGRASHRSFGNGCSQTCICILVYKIYKLHISKYLNDM